MILNETEQLVFFKVRDALISYADTQLMITGRPVEPSRVRRLMVQEDIVLVIKKICEHKEILDDFISENPYQFTESELEYVHDWKNVVADNTVLVTFPDGVDRFIIGDYAFEVCGLSVEVESMIEQEGTVIVWLAMLPFRGKIVHAGAIEEQKVEYGQRALKAFEISALNIYKDNRIVRTADELKSAWEAISQARAQRIGEHAQSGAYQVK